MAKHGTMKKHQKHDREEFDFSDSILDPQIDEAMFSMMSDLVESSRHQMQIAVELTKLAEEEKVVVPFKEEDIFSIFRRASKVVADSSPIKELLEKMN